MSEKTELGDNLSAQKNISNNKKPLLEISEKLNFTNLESKTLKDTWIRWLVLYFVSVQCFACYFCFDNPQALQVSLEATLNIDLTQFNLLYSLFSFPNIILPLFGGLLVDLLGIRAGLLIFGGLTAMGQALTTIGSAKLSFTGLLVGRLLFGIGFESLEVSIHVIIAKWFKNKEIALAFGIILMATRLGSSMNTLLSPRIYLWTNSLYTPFLVGTIFMTGSWLLSFISCFYDKKLDTDPNLNLKNKERSRFSFQHLKSFSLLYYLVLINCGLLYGSYFALMDNLNDIMAVRFGFTMSSAGTFILIVYIIGGVLNIVLGLYFDKAGKRVLWILLSAIIFLISHMCITFFKDTYSSPNYLIILPLIGIGLFISIYSTVFWPCIPLIIDEKVTGTAYGLVGSMMSLAIASLPVLAGIAHDKTEDVHYGYFWSEIVLSGAVLIAIFITMQIYFLDKRRGGVLDKNKKEAAEAVTSSTQKPGDETGL